MDSSFALYLGRHTLETALMLTTPILVACLVVGVVITLLQAVTSIRDMTLAVVPKLLALGVVALLFSSWMLQVTLRFTLEIFAYMQSLGGG
ncbi:MAG: flagellar biosynthetic protein FliQ [Planctomycetes bacterium]|jgi:flagellar biosynthetic protein FliQ|nr:flagellar biosynthetic protein FliQ [Planctomycetota bacterium]